MAKKQKQSSQKKENLLDRKLTEPQRWVIGLILLGFGVFLLVAVVFYYFYWSDDQQAVENLGVFNNNATIANPTGPSGAKMAHYVVGQWFGVFGVVIPVVLIILALRIMNYRPAFLQKSIRVSLIIAILGSLSLGFIFRDKWEVFGSGLGGWHGIVISDWLRSILGGIGTGIVLLIGWILTGVYINSKRTIAAVNKMGRGIYDSSVRVGETVVDRASEVINAKAKIREEEVEKATNPYYIPSDKEQREPERDVAAVNEWREVFEVTDARSREEEVYEQKATEQGSRRVVTEDGVFEVISTKPESAGGETKLDPENRVVMFGEDAGEYIIDSSEHHEQYHNRGAYTDEIIIEGEPVRFEKANVGAQAQKREYYEQNAGEEFEVIDLGLDGQLSAGGVVEAYATQSAKMRDTMQVVVAGRRDVELDDDQIDDSLYDPTKELSKYQKPPIELLEDHSRDVKVTEQEVYDNKNQIVETLDNFGIKIDKIKATIGPTVTLYEIVPAPGIKVSRIKNLEDDIALSLKALGIRIIAPMPGQGTVGIEVPNKDPEIVSMYSVIKTKKFQESNYELPVVLGKTIANETFIIDLAKMPHLLVAGATGQGKSVGLNVIITSLLYKKHPSELKFVMIDPKRVELSLYSKLEKHYLAKMESEEEAVLTDTQKVVYTLNALCTEMSNRYDLLRMAEVRKISEYNERFTNRRLNPRKGHRFLPYIVVVIDEFADMIMTAGREIETPLTRLAQLARAVGIHLVIATQRPDVKVITGLIKANFPARIAFRVTSMVDSRTIIDQPGANQLIGRGDMLISLNGELTRLQCAFVDTAEVERVTEFIGNQRGYAAPYELPDYKPDSEQSSGDVDLDTRDAIFEEVANFVVEHQQGSTSSIQRRFAVGYNRAGRIMDQLEAIGVVGRAEGSRPREVLLKDINSLEYILNKLNL